MNRASRYMSAFVLALACSACEGEQAVDGCECVPGFQGGMVFDPGTALRLVLTFCTGPDCTSTGYPPDPDPVESSGLFAWVHFFVTKNQLGQSGVGVFAAPQGKIAAGDVHTHSLLVHDADTGAMLASHTETVTYDLVIVCNTSNQCVRGEFSAPAARDQ